MLVRLQDPRAQRGDCTVGAVRDTPLGALRTACLVEGCGHVAADVRADELGARCVRGMAVRSTSARSLSDADRWR